MIQLDKEFDDTFVNENVLKEYEQIPNKIKNSLEKGKTIDKELNNDKLSLMINDCILIENNIKNIYSTNDDIKKLNSSEEKEIKFSPEENEINKYLETIKNICNIFIDNKKFLFKWKSGRNYSLSNNNLIATKNNGGNAHNCYILGDIILPKNKISEWKIKLINISSIYEFNILIGVGPSNLNQNENHLFNKTWTFVCSNSKLLIQSGNYSDYNGHKEKQKEGDIIGVIMNNINGELSFSVNDNKIYLKDVNSFT